MALYEVRNFTIKPGMVKGYLDLLGGLGMEAQAATAPHLVGCFTTEVGAVNNVVHLWRWDSWQQRTELRNEVVKNPKLPQFSAASRDYVQDMRSELWLPSSFSQMK